MYVYNFTMFTGPLAVLCNSSLDPQTVGWSKQEAKRMCPGQAGTLEYTTEAHHVLHRHLCGVWGIDRLGRGAKERETERKKTVWVFPAVITPVTEGSRAASAACCFSPSLAIFQWQYRRLRKRLRETTQAPSSFRLVTNPCPPSLEIFSAVTALL